jgi:sugar O-acyltransferase (sialic acid O-acetyltransferase NeuD family)
MKQKLIILGTGGSAYDILDTVEAINARAPTWELVGFLDDSLPVGSLHLELPILGGLRDAGRIPSSLFVNAIGSDKSYRLRPEILATTGLDRNRFATLVHPAASVSPRARLGCGVCAHFGVNVAGGVIVGDHVSIYPGCIVGHDAVIEDYVIVAPGAVISGFVHIERGSYIGARAVIRQHLQVGSQALVGMGAVVVRDVPAEVRVVGNPARTLASRSRLPSGTESRPADGTYQERGANGVQT